MPNSQGGNKAEHRECKSQEEKAALKKKKLRDGLFYGNILFAAN